MRNGDFVPSRWEAQADAINILFDAKTGSNPENMVGIMSMAGKGCVCGGSRRMYADRFRPDVLVTLTRDMGKILSAMHATQLSGSVNLASGINVAQVRRARGGMGLALTAQLALKHRQNKNQRQRVVVFVGSPVADTEEGLVQLAKKLKKNNVAVDVVNFGEDAENHEKLSKLIEAVDSNGNSHLLSVSADSQQMLSESMLGSPIVMGEAADTGEGPSSAGGAGFGVDPNVDPELAMALRMSMEEEEARQRAAQSGQPAPEGQPAAEGQPPAESQPSNRDGAVGSMVPSDAQPITGTAHTETQASNEAQSEQAMLDQALALSRGDGENDVQMESQEAPRATVAGANDGDADEEMTEEEAIARAIQMSLKDGNDQDAESKGA